MVNRYLEKYEHCPKGTYEFIEKGKYVGLGLFEYEDGSFSEKRARAMCMPNGKIIDI